jgi:3-methylfumaryl-CoA hydratase
MTYRHWIGRQFTGSEAVSDRVLNQFRATFGTMLAPNAVPPGLHWCLMPDIAPADRIGRDGTPQQGIFIPELPLPRRMWAGGELTFARALQPGETLRRVTTITDIAEKAGATGPLIFLTMDMVWSVGEETVLTERRDFAYREDPRPGSGTTPDPAPDWPEGPLWTATPDPVLLFRYSAMTFNGHRIHYDHPYATAVEGYDGLVVHGPLQATWMLNLAATVLGQTPKRFRYRGMSPLICNQAVRIEGRKSKDGLALRVRNASGVVTMQGMAG